ncbi:Bifunctional protein PutA [compost metagenome]
MTLPGPTGERNTYSLLPRERVLCLAQQEADLLTQLAAVLAVGAQALWPDTTANKGLLSRLPQAVQSRVRLAANWQDAQAADAAFDAVLHHGDSDQLRTVCEQVAQRPGPIVGVQGLAHGEPNVALERLLIERSLSVNTAAAGGNASLMTIG